GLFLAQQKARKLATWAPDVGQVVHQTPIRRVAVIGAGAMGAGIGQLAAVRGYDVVLKEINEQAALAGQRRVEKLVDDLAKRKRWGSKERSELMSRIAVDCDDQVLADCDLVIEAVVEQMEVKESVFKMLDDTTMPSSILASNTSSLSVTDMARVTNRGNQVAGLHFFNPVHRMELVEVVRGEKTDDETLVRLVSFVKALGKTPVVTADAPGFLVNRVLFPYLGEAVRMVGEGGDVAEIDKQVRRFGMPMGPLQLLDQVGIDVAYHVAHSLSETLPGVESVARTLSAMVEAGQLGKKTQCGFYRYSPGRSHSVAELPLTTRTRTSPEPSQFFDDSLTPIQRRLIYPMLAEAVRCHEQQIVEEPWAIDLAVVLGTGFSPHTGGPLHLIDTIGVKTVAANLAVLHAHFGDRFSVPDELTEMSAHGESYFIPRERLPTRTASS
ncbi:MAG: 3-hydroxyacyl-CoA dehydrogenase NAD-binding domain-containing protein, partial [Rubripirellula sp.]|nr:3-hydroxyacyl-CoA dehydrogenase NAD-binding domain-containing protein [Rubripirellula sp.]